MKTLSGRPMLRNDTRTGFGSGPWEDQRSHRRWPCPARPAVWRGEPPRGKPVPAPRQGTLPEVLSRNDAVTAAGSGDASSPNVGATTSSCEGMGAPFGRAPGPGDEALPSLSATGASQLPTPPFPYLTASFRLSSAPHHARYFSTCTSFLNTSSMVLLLNCTSSGARC